MRKQDVGLGNDIAYIVAGTFLMALGVNLAFEPMGLVCGGVTGLAIVVKYLTGLVWEGGIPVWLSNLLFNGPLFVVALLKKEKNISPKPCLQRLCFPYGCIFCRSISFLMIMCWLPYLAA